MSGASPVHVPGTGQALAAYPVQTSTSAQPIAYAELVVGNYVSQGNNTNVALAGSSTWTGDWEFVGPWEGLSVAVKTDAPGTLLVDYSVNASDVDSTITASVSSGVNEIKRLKNYRSWSRVRYTNSTTAQTYMRLQTIYTAANSIPTSALNFNVQPDADATIVRSVDTTLDISAGKFVAFHPVNKFGRAPDSIDQANTDIWDLANTTNVWVAPTQARVHLINSTAPNDNVASSGARTVKIYGLTTWNNSESEETVSLNGTTSVLTTTSYVIIDRMRVVSWGNSSSSPNEGAIYCAASTDATTTAAIRATIGSTEMAIKGIPSTQKGYITQWGGSINKAQGAPSAINYRLLKNEYVSTQTRGFVEIDLRGVESDGNSNFERAPKPYIRIDGPAIVKIQGSANTDGVDGSAGFDMILVDN